jgi:Ca2+-binding RTX toxin-like protein
VIPYHIAFASADAQGRPIDPGSIGGVYWVGWNAYFSGPGGQGLISHSLATGVSTTLQPASVRIDGFDGDSLARLVSTPQALLASDTNGVSDVYYQWSSPNNNAAPTQITNGNGPSTNARFVDAGANGFTSGYVFESTATNLLSSGSDTNGASDIYLRHSASGSPITRVSVTATGGEANGASYNLSAADWRPMVIFTSDATNLLGDGQGGLFWKDLANNALKRVNATSDGTIIAGVTDGDVAAYGRYVVFASDSATAVSGDTNGLSDVFMKDMETGQLTRVSTASDGAQLSVAAADPVVSSDGRYVAFEGAGQIYVKDTTTGDLVKLTNSPGPNNTIGFEGPQLMFSNQGGGVVSGVTTDGYYIASLGGDLPARSGVRATTDTFTIPDGIDDALIASNRGGYVITGNALGNIFQGSHYANTFNGAGGDDLFRLDRAGVTATGGAGFDTYLFLSSNPFAPTQINDFRIGEDELDLRQVLGTRAATDPTVDGYIRFESDGAGGTRVYYDPDGTAGAGSAVQMAVLRDVPVSSVSWSAVTDRNGPTADEPPVLSSGPAGQGAALFRASVNESALKTQASVIGTGGFYVSAKNGVDDVTVGGHAVITDGVFQPSSFATALGSQLEFVSYDTASGRVAFNYILLGKQHHPYVGGINDYTLIDAQTVVATDRDGDTATGRIEASIRDDVPYLGSDIDLVDRAAGRSTGNVIAGVRDAETQNSGRDTVPVDGATVGRIEILRGARDDTADANGDYSIEGAYGTLTINQTGDYTYVLKPDAPAGGIDRFQYWLKDGDSRPLNEFANLEFRITTDSGSASGGRVINSPGPGSTLTGGTGNDTLNGSAGPDVLTGGDGDDVFAWAQAPWAPARVTDFRSTYNSNDRLDLSKVLQSVGYTGDDPVRDGYIKLISVDGGTGILLDRDGPAAGQQYGDYIIKLDNVNPTYASWSGLTAQNVYYWLDGATVARPEGDSGATTFAFTVNRNGGATAGEGTVTWAATGAGFNPASAADFVGGVLPSGTITFAPGQTSRTIEIQVAGDTVVEPEETFRVSLTGSTGGSRQNYTAQGTIGNDDGSAPPPGDGGQVLTSPGPNSTVTGGAGSDTLNASQGSDILTGGGGGDVFRWGKEPWSPATVTDFAVGSDRIDLSALLQTSGYAGSDPVADKYISLTAQGADTLILFDRDATGTTQQWPNYIIKLQGVSGATWAQISGGGGTTNPPPSASQINLTTGALRLGEGDSGVTAFQFELTRSGATSGTTTADWSVAGSGSNPADAADFAGGALPRGVVSFAPGETTKWVTVNVAGDTIGEPNEEFQLTLSNPSAGTTFANSVAIGTIVNTDANSPPPASPGQVYTSPGPGSTVTGGSGDDTINGSQGSDVLTGGAGADKFAWAKEPWSPATLTDFVSGVDRLDISALLQASGYTGSDPVADRYVHLTQSGSDTLVLFDRDGSAAGQQWPNYIIKLAGVGGEVTWDQLTRADSPNPPPTDPPPSSGSGVVLTSSRSGDTLAGGAGDDTLNAGRGPDQLSGGGGADHFVYADAPWNAGRVTDFTPGTDKLDLRGIFDDVGYAGTAPQTDGWLILRQVSGGTEVLVDIDGPNASGEWPITVTTLTGISPGALTAADWIVQ